MTHTKPLACVILLALLTVTPAQSQDTPAPGATKPGSVAASEPAPNAAALLDQMANTLAQAQRFSVDIRASYDVVQRAGQKITFEEQRSIVASRPDKIKMETWTSDGRARTISFDGSAITVFDARENVYGRVDVTGTIDEAVRHLTAALNVRVPLALMLVSSLPSELKMRVKSIDYVERDVLTPVPTHHLAASTADVDFEIWIGADGPTVPHRVVITYKREEGAPQYRAEFADWDFAPDPSLALATFEPPQGAERIPFLVRKGRRPLETAEEKKPATAKGATK
jgi:hypothetical protein